MWGKWKVEWSGDYPALCKGKWFIFKNNKDVSYAIPEGLRQSPMKTYKVYEKVEEFGGKEFHRFFYAGLDHWMWIEENASWLKKICDTYEDMLCIFALINEKDWCFNGCGGCL